MEYKVALVDDHHLVRSGLAATVNALDGYHVVIEAGHGRELIESLSGIQPPDIAVVDLNMPVMDGYETISWLKENEPSIHVLALTFDAGEDAMIRAVRAGARGFILKNVRPQTLKLALDSLMLTGFYYSDELDRTLKDNPDMRTRHEREKERVLERITPREMEFLLHVCSEREPTYEQIADAMSVHRRTVDGYRIGLFEKFDIKSKTGLVLFAMRWGILD